jgi:lipoic acid synthetase
VLSEDPAVPQGRFPHWLHRKLPKGEELFNTSALINKHRLHTVCEEAKCPNLLECYSNKTATFLVMGKECTRACGFCDIDFSKQPKSLDAEEAKRVAESVQQLGLRHVVITMVARDDLADGGAAHLVKIVEKVRQECPEVTVEVLTSDFSGNCAALDIVIAAKPEIFNHNLETVRSLTPKVRHTATYERTLFVLAYVKKNYPTQLVKSGLMLGLGEQKEEIVAALEDLSKVGCDIVTIGQYLQASRKKLPVREFVHPTTFEEYATIGRNLGIKYVYAGPFVRSSYNAGLVVNEMKTITSR